MIYKKFGVRNSELWKLGVALNVRNFGDPCDAVGITLAVWFAYRDGLSSVLRDRLQFEVVLVDPLSRPKFD
jgi:hypothetical protein